MIEYALLLTMITVIAIGAIKAFAYRASEQFSFTASVLGGTL